MKWLMGLTLALGLFAFSGFVSESRAEEKPRTEVGISLKVHTKNAVSFKKFLTAWCIPAYTNSQSSVVFSLVRFEQIIKTKLKTNLKSVLAFKEPAWVLKAVYTPRQTDHIISPFLRG